MTDASLTTTPRTPLDLPRHGLFVATGMYMAVLVAEGAVVGNRARIRNGVHGTDYIATIDQIRQFAVTIGWISAVIHLAFAGFFGWYLARAVTMLRAAGHETGTKTWVAALCFLVPPINLVAPYFVLRAIGRSVGNPMRKLNTWWPIYFLGWLLVIIAAGPFGAGAEEDPPLTALLAMMVYLFGTASALGALMGIVQGLHDRILSIVEINGETPDQPHAAPVDRRDLDADFVR